jgi:hypothetical protein
MLDPCRDLEYPFALGIMDMPTIHVPPKKDIPAEHALDTDDGIHPSEGGKPADPPDRPKDTLAEPDEIGVHVI